MPLRSPLAANDTSLAQLTADDGLDNLELVADQEDAQAGGAAGTGEEGVNEALVVKLVNKVLMDAINRGASDIHIEPYEKTYRVRYRQDGILPEIMNLAAGAGQSYFGTRQDPRQTRHR